MRGEIWTVAGGRGYAGKPRPCLVIQDDAYADLESITVLLITSTPPAAEMPLLRPRIRPTADNGLTRDSWVQIDKATTVRRRALGQRVGRLSRQQMGHVGSLLMAFLGI